MDISVYQWIFEIDSEEEVEQRGGKCVGEGSSRRVYAIDDTVVLKIAKDEIGRRQNLIEYRVYNRANEDQRAWLAPVYEKTLNDKFLLMRRANTDDVSYVPELRVLEPLIEEFKLLQDDLTELSSWGEIEGEIVCVDYGCDQETRNEYDDTMLSDSLLDEEDDEHPFFSFNL